MPPKKPLTVIEKRESGCLREVKGIYRSLDLPMPKVGEDVRVVNEESGIEKKGTVTAINWKDGTYDIEIKQPAMSAGGESLSLRSLRRYGRIA